jgi:hypothetical protein
VAWEDAEFALDAREHDLGGLDVEDGLGGRDDLEEDGIRHDFFSFLTLSSGAGC